MDQTNQKGGERRALAIGGSPARAPCVHSDAQRTL